MGRGGLGRPGLGRPGLAGRSLGFLGASRLGPACPPGTAHGLADGGAGRRYIGRIGLLVCIIRRGCLAVPVRAAPLPWARGTRRRGRSTGTGRRGRINAGVRSVVDHTTVATVTTVTALAAATTATAPATAATARTIGVHIGFVSGRVFVVAGYCRCHRRRLEYGLWWLEASSRRRRSGMHQRIWRLSSRWLSGRWLSGRWLSGRRLSG